MATIEKFEDLEVWKDARSIVQKIFKISIETELKNDFGLKNQIRNSSGSIMDNIAEGFERGGNVEFRQFLSYAKGSAGETRSQIHRLFDYNYISKEEHDTCVNELENISRKISNFIKYLNKNDYKGTKFKNEN